MHKLIAIVSAALLGGCAGVSYGVTADGTFPPRPASADYPNWEHACFTFDEKNATDLLTTSGQNGWELVAVGKQGGNDLMCFKRPKPAR